MSSTSVRPLDAEDTSDIAGQVGKEQRVSALSGKMGRKKEQTGDGGAATSKKDKKLKTASAGAGRMKGKASGQTAAPVSVEPTDGSATSLP